MNSFMSVALTAIVILAPYFSLITGEQGAAFKKAIDHCYENHNISKRAVLGILNHDLVLEDHEVKCCTSCVLKSMGMMKDGKLDWEHCKIFTKEGLPDEEDKAKVNKIAELCGTGEVSLKEKDSCQLTYAVVVCKINYWKKLGLPKKNMEL